MTQNIETTKAWPELEAAQNPVSLSADEIKERNKKNVVVGLALVAFVALTFFVTIAKLATNFGA
jgi:hypothetical protein